MKPTNPKQELLKNENEVGLDGTGPKEYSGFKAKPDLQTSITRGGIGVNDELGVLRDSSLFDKSVECSAI